MLKFFLSVTLFVLFCVGRASSLVNEEVSRLLDLRGHNVEVSLNVTLSEPNLAGGVYQIPIENRLAKHLAFASASSGSKVLVVSHIDASGADDYAVWEVALGKNTEKFQLKFVFTNVQIALPKEILQEDNQFLVFNDNLYFLSPYLTKSQTTKVWLASHHVEEYSEEGEANVDGAIITYGPYKDIKPFSNAKKLRVHYENNSPAIRFPMVQQTIALPSWGNSAKVSNRYSIEHAGALLKGRFSRLDYQLRNGPETDPSFRRVSVQVEDYEYDHKFSDDIGNISSSFMDFNESSLELDMRYPLFGGWKASFLTSHQVPAEKVHDARRRRVFVRFGVPVKGAVTEQLFIDVVFPPGFRGKNFRAEGAPYEVMLSSTVDSKGSQVLRLSKSNIVYDHVASLQIAYDSA